MEYLKTEGLQVGYSGKPLIKDINLSIKKGEIVTLIGPNGAGKSTILKSITKHLQIIKGEVKVTDASLSKMSYRELARKLAVVLTERVKGELLTCYDVVSTGRYPYTNSLGLLSDEDKEKVADAFEKVHATELANRDFTAISDGQRQRVLLARAICQEPEIIVLDEPTSFLDIRHKLELLNILRAMAKEKNITVIMSLHEIDLAQKISDKVICVGGDKIQYFGKPEEIFRDDIIRELYHIEQGTYNITFGSVELPRPEGEPEIFVIGGAGTGISLYRALQKENKPFYAGILHKNDVDYQVAVNLAAEVFSAEPFEKISDGTYDEALEAIKKCKYVISTGAPIGETNSRLQELEDYARRENRLVKELPIGGVAER